MPRKKPEPAKTSEQDTWKEDASKLSYEEALQAVDVLLGQLQDDSVPLADLQKNYARAPYSQETWRPGCIRCP